MDCKSSLKAKVESILKWAHFAGKSTGIVLEYFRLIFCIILNLLITINF